MSFHWSIGVLENDCVRRSSRFEREHRFVKIIEYFFRVYITSLKHLGGWDNSRKLCKPSTVSSSYILSRMIRVPLLLR